MSVSEDCKKDAVKPGLLMCLCKHKKSGLVALKLSSMIKLHIFTSAFSVLFIALLLAVNNNMKTQEPGPRQHRVASRDSDVVNF